MTSSSEMRLSRRGFVGSASLLAAFAAMPATAFAAGEAITARGIVDRIKASCAAQGIAWMDETTDVFKVGDPDVEVTGIVSTFMATLDIMRQAADAGANFIISHEPIFYHHFDDGAGLEDDPVYLAKRRFAEDNGITVWRFHDHLHRIQPEPMSTGFYRAIGWEGYLDAQGSGFRRRIAHPRITLADLAAEIASDLPSRSVRVIGDPALEVTRIGQAGHNLPGLIGCYADCQVGMGAEIREWDSAEYARDARDLGMPRAMIMIAHERGEQDGMDVFVDWLRAVVPDVPVRFISSGEPFRTL